MTLKHVLLEKEDGIAIRPRWRDISECFVDRDLFNKRGLIANDIHDDVRHLTIAPMIPMRPNSMWAELCCSRGGHRAAHAERASLI